MNHLQASAVGPEGREHVLVYPRGWIIVRIVQLALAFLIMILSAYTNSLLSFDGNAFILAVAVMNIVYSIYHMVAHFSVAMIYNYWAILAVDIFFVVMWLCSFALQAARVAAFYDYASGYRLATSDQAWLGAQAAAAALGAVEWVLFIVTLVIHSIRLHRHRAAGGHCMPGQAPTPPAPAPTAAAGAAPHGGEKINPGPAYPAQYAPQPQQQQQPVGNPGYQQQFSPQQQPQYPPQGQQQAYPPQQAGYPGQQQQQQQQQHQAFYPSPSPSPAPMYAPQPQTLPAQLPSDHSQQHLPPQLDTHSPSPLPAQLPGN